MTRAPEAPVQKWFLGGGGVVRKSIAALRVRDTWHVPITRKSIAALRVRDQPHARKSIAALGVRAPAADD